MAHKCITCPQWINNSTGSFINMYSVACILVIMIEGSSQDLSWQRIIKCFYFLLKKAHDITIKFKAQQKVLGVHKPPLRLFWGLWNNLVRHKEVTMGVVFGGYAALCNNSNKVMVKCANFIRLKGVVLETETSLIARFMGSTWGLPGADRTQVGPMWATVNLAIWGLLSK